MRAQTASPLQHNVCERTADINRQPIGKQLRAGIKVKGVLGHRAKIIYQERGKTPKL